jgi:D-alanyl-D-alanine carboxypeptidase
MSAGRLVTGRLLAPTGLTLVAGNRRHILKGGAMLRRFRVVSAVMAMAATALSPRASAGPVLLFDPGSGHVVYSDDADKPWYPASLTKLMTGYVTFIALKEGKVTWETKLVTSEKAHAQPPSKIGLPVGGEMSLDQGVRALIIKSANDVAMMLAETVGGSEEGFVEKMNLVAKRLGMSRTRFVNPHGLPDPQQVTTARDMGLLARAVLRDFPEYATLFAEEKMYVGRIRLRTHNSLLKTFQGADGMKTGFVCASGFNVVASATRDGRKLVAVVLGETSGLARAQRATSLLEYGFENQAWKTHFDPRRIDNMGMQPQEAAEPQDLRQLDQSFLCGQRGRPRVRNKVVAQRAAAKSARVAGKGAKKGEPVATAAVPSSAGAAGPTGDRASSTAAAAKAPAKN